MVKKRGVYRAGYEADSGVHSVIYKDKFTYSCADAGFYIYFIYIYFGACRFWGASILFVRILHTHTFINEHPLLLVQL